MATNPQHQASTGIALSSPAAPELRCKYANKVCCKERAVKADGTPHSLCEEHRSKAKINQQRYRDNIKRQRKIQAQIDSNNGVVQLDAEDQDQLLEPFSAPAVVDFDENELKILIECVFDRSDMTSGGSTGTGV